MERPCSYQITKIIKDLRPGLNFVFLIVGVLSNRESYKDNLYKQVKENSLESNVIFTGSKIGHAGHLYSSRYRFTDINRT